MSYLSVDVNLVVNYLRVDCYLVVKYLRVHCYLVVNNLRVPSCELSMWRLPPIIPRYHIIMHIWCHFEENWEDLSYIYIISYASTSIITLKCRCSPDLTLFFSVVVSHIIWSMMMSAYHDIVYIKTSSDPPSHLLPPWIAPPNQVIRLCMLSQCVHTYNAPSTHPAPLFLLEILQPVRLFPSLSITTCKFSSDHKE